MKKLCYQVEEKNTIAYIVFSCFCVFGSIISIIVSMLAGAKDKDIFAGIPAIILFAIFVYIIFFIDDKSKEKDRKQLNDIKQNGTKIEGTIIKFNEYRTRSYNGDGHHTYYSVIVEYVKPHTNEKMQYETPVLSFDAFHRLGSKKCSVYILNDKIYVTDFVKVNKGEENIWAREDEKYKELANLEKKEISKLVIRMILFILLWFGIVIWGLFFW